MFDRLTGQRRPKLDGVGGTYALLTGDVLVHGPGPQGGLTAHVADQGDRLARFDGNHLIATATVSYLHTDNQLRALDRADFSQRTARRAQLVEQRDRLGVRLANPQPRGGTEEIASLRAQWETTSQQIDALAKELAESPRVLWETACDCPYSLILAGDRLLAGGDDKVAAFDARSGQREWQETVAGRACGLAAANGRLYVSTDAGTIHSFAARGTP